MKQFTQVKEAKVWSIGLDTPTRVLKDLKVFILDDAGDAKEVFPKVSYKDSQAILKFKTACAGGAKYEEVEGRTTAYKIFGGFK